jgi:hypothetical protein
MCKTLVRPGLTYASETWVLSKADEISLVLSERRVLRCNSGAVQDKVTWSKGHNRELYELFNEPDITTRVKINRSSWASHIVRMESSRAVKKVFDTRHEGTRKIGRHKLRWEDGVIQDIKALGVKIWRNVAMNVENWLKLLKKGRVHTGLSSR